MTSSPATRAIWYWHATVMHHTSYLSEPKERSHVGGHHFMSSDSPIPLINGAVLNITQLIKVVVTSAADAKIGALYINTLWEDILVRQTLVKMGQIRNHILQCKQATQHPLEPWTATYYHKEPRRWTWYSTGYKPGTYKARSNIFDNQVWRTCAITGKISLRIPPESDETRIPIISTNRGQASSFAPKISPQILC